MHRLTRLFLKMTVRVSLVLAVVLWALSYYAGVTVSGSIFKKPFRVINCEKGIAVAVAESGPTTWGYESLSPTAAMEAGWVFDPTDQDLQSFDRLTLLPGLKLLRGSGRVIASGRHSFLIGTAILANLAFTFLNRRSPVSESDD